MDRSHLADWPSADLARTPALLDQRLEVPFAMAVWQLVALVAERP